MRAFKWLLCRECERKLPEHYFKISRKWLMASCYSVKHLIGQLQGTGLNSHRILVNLMEYL